MYVLFECYREECGKLSKALEMSREKEHIYRVILYMILAGAVTALAIVIYFSYWNKIPSTIKIRAGVEQKLDFHVPVSGEIYRAQEADAVREASALEGYGEEEEKSGKVASVSSASVHVDFAKEVTVRASQIDSYQMELKLFGVLPYKNVDVQVIQDKMLIPSGMPIGIYVKTEGVLVVGVGEYENENGKEVSPARYILQKGDYILKVNGEEIENKKQFIQLVEASCGEDIVLTIKRNDEITGVMIRAEQNQNREWKLGIWIRDNAQGIGTLTYEDTEHQFGALGHGINDMDTSILMDLAEGTLYKTEIIGITRGTNGAPGELTGFIEYDSRNVIGEITHNTPHGIFGVCDDSMEETGMYEPIPIALKQEIETGPAQIICSVTGEPEFYDVEITEINLDQGNINRELVVQVKDEKLLTLTGGIIQGMSGSPIIQNGKFVGAVTHVLVNDPTRGYGIFIEEMLEH